MPEPSTPSSKIPIDTQFMFSNHKNVHKAGIEKRQRKLLRKIPSIGAFLAPDEKVLLVIPCISPTSFFEQWSMGWVFMIVNRALLVVTDKGMFHVPAKANYDYRHSIAKFNYADCKELRVKGRFLYVQYANGEKERFMYLPRAQRLKLKAYLPTVKLGANAAAKAGRTHLCPRCTRPLAPDTYQCGGCRLPFKDMATATKLSLLIPGGGYFYTGHPILGLGDFVVELALLALVIGGIAGMIAGEPTAMGNTIFFGIVLALEKLLTIHHAKRYISEYIPLEKKIRLQPATA